MELSTIPGGETVKNVGLEFQLRFRQFLTGVHLLQCSGFGVTPLPFTPVTPTVETLVSPYEGWLHQYVYRRPFYPLPGDPHTLSRPYSTLSCVLSRRRSCDSGTHVSCKDWSASSRRRLVEV